jgi:hypothetical protein
VLISELERSPAQDCSVRSRREAVQQGVEADEAEHNGASQLNSRVVSSERRNISAMIRATCSGRPGWSVNGRATRGV